MGDEWSARVFHRSGTPGLKAFLAVTSFMTFTSVYQTPSCRVTILALICFTIFPIAPHFHKKRGIFCSCVVLQSERKVP